MHKNQENTGVLTKIKLEMINVVEHNHIFLKMLQPTMLTLQMRQTNEKCQYRSVHFSWVIKLYIAETVPTIYTDNGRLDALQNCTEDPTFH